MRKLTALFLAAILLLTLTGCSKSNVGTVGAAVGSEAVSEPVSVTPSQEPDPMIVDSGVDINDFQLAKNGREYLDLDAYAEEFGFSIISSVDTDGIHCETSNGVFVMLLFSGQCRFYAGTEEDGVFQYIQVVDYTSDEEATYWTKLDNVYRSNMRRADAALRIWLEWVLNTDDALADPFDGIKRSVGVFSNVEISADKKTIDFTKAELSQVEGRK
jgi:hypothetical protein